MIGLLNGRTGCQIELPSWHTRGPQRVNRGMAGDALVEGNAGLGVLHPIFGKYIDESIGRPDGLYMLLVVDSDPAATIPLPDAGWRDGQKRRQTSRSSEDHTSELQSPC